MVLNIDTIEANPGPFKGLIYGPPGVGKTKLCGSFEVHDPGSVLVVDSERGARTFLNHPELRKINVMPVGKYDEVWELHEALLAGKYPEFKTIVIDSISELQKRHMDEHLKKMAKRDSKRSPFLAYQNDYKENTEIMRAIVVQYCDLPGRNLIITAHAVEQQDESDGSILIRPAVTPKLASTLHGLMDFVGYLSLDISPKGEERRTLQVQPSRRITAKTRLAFKEAIIKDPTAEMILKANAYERVEESSTLIPDVA